LPAINIFTCSLVERSGVAPLSLTDSVSTYCASGFSFKVRFGFGAGRFGLGAERFAFVDFFFFGVLFVGIRSVSHEARRQG
jgi:hypothetical protein